MRTLIHRWKLVDPLSNYPLPDVPRQAAPTYPSPNYLSLYEPFKVKAPHTNYQQSLHDTKDATASLNASIAGLSLGSAAPPPYFAPASGYAQQPPAQTSSYYGMGPFSPPMSPPVQNYGSPPQNFAPPPGPPPPPVRPCSWSNGQSLQSDIYYL
ncbi:hypothetical protein T439DRAFT_195070 [Meredithblackwellia eburnea MCA 4105]